MERAPDPPGTSTVRSSEDVARDYRAAFLRYLPRGDEAALHSGYLLGRAALEDGLSILEIAQTLVTIGVDLSKMNTIGDLQGGLEEAERLLGYRVGRDQDRTGP